MVFNIIKYITIVIGIFVLLFIFIGAAFARIFKLKTNIRDRLVATSFKISLVLCLIFNILLVMLLMLYIRTLF